MRLWRPACAGLAHLRSPTRDFINTNAFPKKHQRVFYLANEVSENVSGDVMVRARQRRQRRQGPGYHPNAGPQQKNTNAGPQKKTPTRGLSKKHQRGSLSQNVSGDVKVRARQRRPQGARARDTKQ